MGNAFTTAFILGLAIGSIITCISAVIRVGFFGTDNVSDNYRMHTRIEWASFIVLASIMIIRIVWISI